MRSYLRYGWIILLFFCQEIKAQKKYALIVGINEYYAAPGKLDEHSLNGCVNDANSIRSLLVDRFGFESTNVSMLLNGTATKKNLLEKFRQILQLVRPGDVFVFYYSGHGVWMKNENNRSDRIKRGMSQAIVMSDLYAPGWGCLVRDETLKSVFNKFIDKKVISTAITDCCFSGRLTMAGRFDLFSMEEDTWAREKDFYIEDLPYYPVLVDPKPCEGGLIDLPDSDRDGVPDCRDKEPWSPRGRVDEKGISLLPVLLRFSYTTYLLEDSMDFGDLPAAELSKAFDLSQTINDTVRSTQPRPVEREGGKFAALAATTENDKGLEIVDMNGSRHGAFTAALLLLYNNSKTDLSLEEITNGVNDLMSKQMYKQGPMIYFEGERGKLNLIGLRKGSGNNGLHAVCLAGKNSIVILNKGKNAGLFPGNVFSGSRRTLLKLYRVMDDSCFAQIIQGTCLKGDPFILTDGYTQTPPRLKVYIPSAVFSPEAFQLFFQKKILPLTRDKYYQEPDPKGELFAEKLLFFSDTGKPKETNPYPYQNTKSFMVFLPFPSYLSQGLVKRLAQNQNIELTSTPEKADMMLMMSYQPNDSSFYICFNSPGILYSGYDRNLFQPIILRKKSLNLIGTEKQQFYDEMDHLVWRYLRKKTTAWLNQYPKRSF